MEVEVEVQYLRRRDKVKIKLQDAVAWDPVDNIVYGWFWLF